MIRIGVAGWSLPRHLTHRFPPEGTHLERYARGLSCVEINSAFYRNHSRRTYARWADCTPAGFSFTVKLSRVITHEWCLVGTGALLRQFLEETAGLGRRRGAILVQLPPSFAFHAPTAGRFFGGFRDRYDGAIACEPRHPSWFGRSAEQLLVRHQIARVAADPPCAEGGGLPGGWDGFSYFRLHGSPRMYWSRYEDDALAQFAERVRQAATRGDVFCIFDNTAAGAAAENAFELRDRIALTLESRVARPEVERPGV